MRLRLSANIAMAILFLVRFGGVSLPDSAWAQQQQSTHSPSEQQVNLATLDIPALLRESDRNGAAMHQRLVEYTYLQKRTTREVGPKGKLTEQIREFEAYPIKTAGRHRHVLSLIRKDGVLLTPEELEKNRLLAAHEMEKAEPQESAATALPGAKQSDKYITAGIGIGPRGEGVWLGVSQFLRQCQFESPRLIQLADRATLLLALHSCAGVSAAPRESYLVKLHGLVWIDLTDKVVVRLEAWPTPASGAVRTSDLSAQRPTNEVLVYEQQFVRGGIWAPRRIHLNGIGRANLFNGVNKEMTFEFTDYRHFSTEIKEKEAVEPIKKPWP
ncbi:MAG TPA: hypothetical protein VFZ34_08795 [Blastocatellia bacterium]|nr:hypothetical protein [Blastocatellia bacterium]